MKAERRLPVTFHSVAILRVLNVLAVGFSLAAATVAVFRHVFHARLSDPSITVIGLPTFVVGVIWATALRHRATIGGTNIRWGWLASIPLAITNSAISCGLLFSIHYGMSFERFPVRFEESRFFEGAVAGATFGAICWIPALVATLLCFGVPIAWSQKLAKKGLAGEERGELIVGVVSTTIAFAVLAFLVPERGRIDAMTDDALAGAAIGLGAPAFCALLGGATGLVATVLAYRREKARRAFVRRVEIGNVEGYRVDATAEGKVLVRVTAMGEGYRVAPIEEPVYGLGETGEAQRSMVVAR